jgi:hypothetical protein
MVRTPFLLKEDARENDLWLLKLACLCGTFVLSVCGSDITAAPAGPAGQRFVGVGRFVGVRRLFGIQRFLGTPAPRDRPRRWRRRRPRQVRIRGKPSASRAHHRRTSPPRRGYQRRLPSFRSHARRSRESNGRTKQQLTLLHRSRGAGPRQQRLHQPGQTDQPNVRRQRPPGRAPVLRTLHSRPARQWKYQYRAVGRRLPRHHRGAQNHLQGKWVNTGASKGGMTSVYHRRFFPNDLDANVAYVAPLSYSQEDPATRCSSIRRAIRTPRAANS